MKSDDAALTWLHLSDLHFVDQDHRNYAENWRLLDGLHKDILQAISKGHKPDLIFLTGDVARTGRRQEYDEATAWTEHLLSAIGLSRQDLFIVPGNHDVHRAKAVDRPVSELVHRALRNDPRYLDSILDHSSDAENVLWPKFEEYLRFASVFGSSLYPGRFYWKSRVETRLGPLLLVGLNTAILSFDNEEGPGDMRLGSRQLGEAVDGASEDLFVVLIHHPLEWLADGTVLGETLKSHPHLILSGHVHDSSFDITQRRNSLPLLELRAGAAQPGDGTNSWSMGRLSAKGLQLWPRMWLPKRNHFRPDNNYDGLKEGQFLKPVKVLPEPLRQWLKRRPPLGPSPQNHPPQLIPPKLNKQGSVKVGDAIVICTAFVAHADALVAAGQDNDVSWFDLTKPEHPRVATLKGHRATVTSLALSQDGRRAVSGGIDKSLIVWDFEGKSLVKQLHVGTWIYALASTEDGTQFIAGDNRNQVTIWNFESAHPIVTLYGHTDWIHDVKISKDNRFAVSASKDRTLRLWDLATGRALHSFRGHQGKVRSVVFYRDNERIVSGDDRGHVLVWETSTGRMVNRLHLHSRTVNSIVVLGDGPFCLSASRDTNLCLFRLDGTGCLDRFTLPSELNGMALSPCGRRIAVACDDGCVYLFGVSL